jgi:xanthine dehydrogenase YagS FAD-binding subunit
MQGFDYQRADDVAGAVRAARAPEAMFLAGGTTVVDLMRQEVLRPAILVDITGLERQYGRIEADDRGLRLGALARMGEAQAHPAVLRDYPVIAQSLQLAASQQIRNMATLGGNVLQRTRCNYFREPSWSACNKRRPGSGCAAIDGVNRKHAVLGASDHCIAAYPGDFGQALVALDAAVEIEGPTGSRVVRFEALHREPGDTPEVETTLQPGEMITGFVVPPGPWTRRSLYLKVRDRQSYEFALASAAVALQLEDGAVREVRVGLGGVATRPWRAHAAETVLRGRPLDRRSAEEAAEAAFAGARTHGENDFKPELGRRTLVRALLEASRLQV